MLQLDGSFTRPVNTALNVSSHPQHSSCPKAACDVSCVLSLAAPDDDLPRPPLSLTLVVDLGSLDEEFARWAVEAAVNLVDWMGPNDRAGIVAFSSQAAEVLQLTPATPAGRDTLRSTLRTLTRPASARTPPASPRRDPFVPPAVLSAALGLALAQQQAAQSAAGGSTSSHLSSSAPASSPCSPRAYPPTYTPPTDFTSPVRAAGPSSALSSDSSSPLIAAAYPSSTSSTTDTAASSPRHLAAAGLRRVSDDGTSDSVSSSGSMHALRAGAASPPPVCRSSPLMTTPSAVGPSDTLSPPPFSHTAFLHPVPENNGGSDDEFEDEADGSGSEHSADIGAGCAPCGPAIHSSAVFLLTPRRMKPCTDPTDDPVAQLRRGAACAAPRHHFVPVSTSQRGRAAGTAAEALPDGAGPAPAADPTVIHGTEHSFSRVPPHIYDPLADPSLDAYDPAASPRPLAASPFLPIPVYAFGVGGVYDPEPLSNLAAATGGAFQHLPRPRDLAPALAAAFGAASAAYAADVEIRVTPLCGSRVAVVRTGYPLWVEGPDVVIHIPEIAARMQKDVLVTLSLPPCKREEMASPCVKHLAGVATVSYTRARTGKLAFRKACIVLPRIEIVGGARGFGTPDPAAVSEHMRLAAAQACADAVRLCAAGSHGQAQRTLLKLRSGIKQLVEVCKANPQGSDSVRCMHARKVLMHVVADLTAAAAAAADSAAFADGGHSALRAIERSHACQVPQAPTSVRRRETGQCPKGSMLRMKGRSTGAPPDVSDNFTQPRCKGVQAHSNVAAAPAASAAHAECAGARKGAEATDGRTAAGNAAAAPVEREQEAPRGRGGSGAASKMNSMLRRVVKRVRSSRARAADPCAAPEPEPATKAASAAATPPPPPLPPPPMVPQRAQHPVDAEEVVGVRVPAYTCQAQMALVAAAVRRAEA